MAGKKTKTTKKPRPTTTTKQTKKKPAALKKPRAVALQIDPRLAKEWKKHLAVLDDAKHRGMSAFDEQWEAVSAIALHEPPLYLAAGCATFRAFLAEYVGEDERTAKRNMRVARFASPAEEAAYGVTKLDAALAYLEAKTGKALHGRVPVAFDKLKIPVDEGDARRNVGLAAATAAQIQAATRAMGSSPAAKESPIVKAVRKALAGDEALRGVGVRYAGGHLSLSFEPSVLARVAKALARTRPPAASIEMR